MFSGVGVALISVFADDLTLDAKASAGLAAQLVERGVEAVIVSGTTGEAFSLDRAERIELIQAVRDQVDVPVIAGTGAPSTRQAVDLTRDAVAAGADGVMALTPARVDDPRPYYEAVRDAAGSTWLAGYHFPAVASPGIPLELLDQLPIDACKDSTGDATRLLAEVAEHSTPIYPGSTALVGMAGHLGMPGVILAAANLAPELCVAAFAGDPDAQVALNDAHAVTRRRPPHGLKQAVADRFGVSPSFRIG